MSSILDKNILSYAHKRGNTPGKSKSTVDCHANAQRQNRITCLTTI